MASKLAPLYDPPELEDMIDVLKTVTDWYTIGLKLNIGTNQLDIIKCIQDPRERMKELYKVWRETLQEEGRQPTWSQLLGVLHWLQVAKVINEVESRYRPGPKPQILPKLGDKPSLKQLYCLTGSDGEKYEVIEKVAFVWSELSIVLEVDWNTKLRIEKENPRDLLRACEKMLDVWLGGCGCKPVTWDRLITAIGDVQILEQFASDLRTNALLPD